MKNEIGYIERDMGFIQIEISVKTNEIKEEMQKSTESLKENIKIENQELMKKLKQGIESKHNETKEVLK
jgi:hypothetical protein